MAAMDAFAADRAQKSGYDPRKSIFGHEELNPGHKEKAEAPRRPVGTCTRVRPAGAGYILTRAYFGEPDRKIS